METLREQFKKARPETVGETDKEFDNSNYIEWLENEVLEWEACNVRQKRLYDELEVEFKKSKETLFMMEAKALQPDFVKPICKCEKIENVYESNSGTRCCKCFFEVPKEWHN